MARMDDGGLGWSAVHEFWFPPGLAEAGAEVHRAMFTRWFGGGTTADLPRFASLVDRARSGSLDGWLEHAQGRLALILLLDQFTRGLCAGTPAAYAADPWALRIARAGIRNGHYDRLAHPWEKTFFVLPLAHAEGPGHLERLDLAVMLTLELVRAVAPDLRPLYAFSAGQARAHRELIARFGRYPHRNAVLGRPSTDEELAYLAASEFVHLRVPPVV
jgi:uncharacterized protein (DUF924 family)